MKKIYNPKDRMRTEMPESDKRLQLKNITLLNQRFGLCLVKNEPKVWDTLENHIENYPECIFNHVYHFKTKEIQKLTLCGIGLKQLYIKLEMVCPKLIANLRKEKYKNKAKRNVAKVLKKTDPLSRVIN
jgi:hypothetical protein